MIQQFFPRTGYGGKVVDGEFQMHYQVWIHNQQELATLIGESNGKCSVFVSHNAYPDRDDQEHQFGEHSNEGCPPISKVKYVTVHQQFVDLDDPEKIENAFGDLRKLVIWAEQERWRWRSTFSGSKGFHFYLLHDPAIYDISETIMVDSTTPVQWRAYYLAAQTYLKATLGLRCIDFNSAEPKRICRVPNTMHFKRGSSTPTGYYCIPLTLDQIMNWNVENIKQLAKNPLTEIDEYWNRSHLKRSMTFDAWLDYYDIQPNILSVGRADVGNALIAGFQAPTGTKGLTVEWWDLFKKLWPGYPCMWNEFYNSRNPRHEARFHTAALLKKMADDPRSIIKIDGNYLFEMYQNLKYDDVHQTEVCRRQIYSIFERGPNSSRNWLPIYEPYSCSRIYAAGLCLGPKCDEVLPSKKKFSRYMSKMKEHLTNEGYQQ